MNIAIEEVSNLRRRLRIEVPADRVNAEFSRITEDFQKMATIKGFRAGKAPLSVIEKRYAKDIEEEVRRKLVPDAFREAVRSKKLQVVNVPGVEDVKVAQKGSTFSFSTVVDLAPDFKLPSYKGIKVKKSDTSITDADVEKVLERIRDQRADYRTVDRAVQQDDFVIITYSGKVDGRPIEEIVPDVPQLGKQEKFWIWIKEDIFLPGFGDQLVGAKAGEDRSVSVTFPGDFAQEALRGQKAQYEVKVEDVREKILPVLDDALAQELAQVPLAELQERIRVNVTADKERAARAEHAKQIFEFLRGNTEFDLPESAVQNETQRALYDIVRENQERGISEDLLNEKKEDLFNAAQTTARDRVKLGFIMTKIAEAEKIEVTPEEFNAELQFLAARYQLTVEKLVKKLRENNNLDKVEEDILNRKTLDFLLQSASME
ncbi:MAG: trigger factor [Candidatus Methylacidiphilales bacterium]|nr:trigger factor [Candidatus Methylacidiphilales bacterium]